MSFTLLAQRLLNVSGQIVPLKGIKLNLKKKIQGDSTINVNRFSDRVPVILFRLQSNLNFLDRFSKKKLSNIKFHENPLTAALFHAGEQTDRRIGMTTLTVAVEILRMRLKRAGSTTVQQSARGAACVCDCVSSDGGKTRIKIFIGIC